MSGAEELKENMKLLLQSLSDGLDGVAGVNDNTMASSFQCGEALDCEIDGKIYKIRVIARVTVGDEPNTLGET